MPTWYPLNDDPVTGGSIPVAFLELEGRTLGDPEPGSSPTYSATLDLSG